MSTFTFPGVVQPLTSALRRHSYAPNDLASPPFRSQYSVGGTLQIGADGDYLLEQGIALYKKLVYRRLYARPGDFFHLPNYGFGMRCKEPVRTNDLVKLKAAAEQQVKLEPETAAVEANPYILRDDTLVIAIKARMKTTGASVDVTVRSEQTGVL
jgi:hypothetical protein